MIENLNLSRETQVRLIAAGFFAMSLLGCYLFYIGYSAADSVQRAVGMLPTLTPITHFSGKTFPSCFAKPDSAENVNVFSPGQTAYINGHTVSCEASVTVPNQPMPAYSLWADRASPDSDMETSSDGRQWTVPKNHISFWLGSGSDALFYSFQFNPYTQLYEQVQPTNPIPAKTATPTASIPPNQTTSAGEDQGKGSESGNVLILGGIGALGLCVIVGGRIIVNKIKNAINVSLNKVDLD